MADRLARWVSILFDSSVLSIPVFLAFGWIDAGAAGLAWAVVMFAIVTGIPLAYLLVGRKRGWVGDMEMTQRSDRPRFIAVSFSSDVFALVLLHVFGGPYLLSVIVLTYLFMAIVMLSISSVWKISMHMAGVGGFSTALVFVFGPPALGAYLALPLVAWARLHRRKHTVAQLIAGAVVGTLVAAAVFTWAGIA